MTLLELFIPALYRYAKKEFSKQEEQVESDVFRTLVDGMYKIVNDEKKFGSSLPFNKELNEIFRNFFESRNQFNIYVFFKYIIDYGSFQKELSQYYRSKSNSAN